MEIQSKKRTLASSCVPTVAWISDFPLEWLENLPEPLRSLPRQHPTTWQRVLLSELENNSALRLHIIVLRKQIDDDFTFEQNGVFFHVLKVPPLVRAPSFFWVDTILIRRALKKIQPDLVHAWGMEKGAATVAARINYPHIVTVQGLFSWLTKVIPPTAYARFIAFLEKISFKRIQIATTESAFAVQYLNKKYPKLQVHQAEHAPNSLFHQIQRRPQVQPIRFVYVGTLSFAKGTDLILRALDELLPDLVFELILISGPDTKWLSGPKDVVSPELWKRITLKTNLTPQKVAEELSVATMMIFPTRGDTSPNAVKEAVVAGVPVIASSIGGIPDYVFPGLNGVLFNALNSSTLKEAVRSACAHPLFSKGLVDEKTLAQTRKYLSPKKMAENFLSIYETAMAQKSARS